MRFVSLFVLVGLAGCGSVQTVGAFDPRDEIDTPPGRSLLVVVTEPGGETDEGLWGIGAAGDFRIEAVERFVPLDSTGAADYPDVAVDALVGALRESGAWGSVEVGALPEGVGLVAEPYAVTQYVMARSRYAPKPMPVLAVAAGTVDAFGPGVDYVLFVHDVRFGLKNGDAVGLGPLGGPATGTLTIYSRDDDAVAIEADLVLWDDAAGTVVTRGVVGGYAPIKSRVFSSASERTPSALLAAARADLRASIERTLPGLLGTDG